MDQYIIDTEYAVENLIYLITIDEKQLFQYQNQCETAKEKEKYFYQQFIDSQFNDDVVTMQEQAKYVAWCQTNEETRKRLTELQEQIRLLQMSINSKSYSISTLCGAVLQIAKQGISIVHPTFRTSFCNTRIFPEFYFLLFNKTQILSIILGINIEQSKPY